MNLLTKKVNLKIKTTLGMFNLAKGILMLMVIFSHVCNFYYFWERPFFWNTIPGTMLRLNQEALGLSVIAVYFMVCGYGFRNVSMKKCVQQMKIPLIMYCFTALGTGLCKLVLIALTQRTQSGSVVMDLVQEILPFLFGMAPEVDNFFGLRVDFVGIVWFVVTYIFSSLILNAVLMIKKESIQWTVIAALGVLSIYLSDLTVPFCLLQSMVGCGYMFVGYQLKKKKVFQKDIPVSVILVLLAVWFVSLKGGGMNLSKNTWYRGVPDLLSSYAAGLIMTAVFLKMDSIKGWISNMIRWIGNNSLIICCTHTISYKIMYWFEFRREDSEPIFAKLTLEMLFHCVFCFGICYLILQIIKKCYNIR